MFLTRPEIELLPLKVELFSGVINFEIVSGVINFELVSGVIIFELVSGVINHIDESELSFSYMGLRALINGPCVVFRISLGVDDRVDELDEDADDTSFSFPLTFFLKQHVKFSFFFLNKKIK